MRKNTARSCVGRIISISLLLIATSTLYAGKNLLKVPPNAIVKPIYDTSENKPLFLFDKEKLFFFGAVGISKYDVSRDVTPLIDQQIGKLDDDGTVYEVGVGYNLTSKWFTTLTYHRDSFDIGHEDTLYISGDYWLPSFSISKTRKIKPFIGLIAGYSQVKWNQWNVIEYYNKDLTSKSMFGGAELGIEIAINDSFSIVGKYQYVQFEHRMVIRSTNIIEGNNQQNILVGGKYAF